MDIMRHFSLPISGMKNGNHTYQFEMTPEFFSHFESEIIQNGHFKAKVEVDKRSNLMIMSSEIEGWMETQCDRCLADINLPVFASGTIHVKFGNPDESDDEVMLIFEDSIEINVSSWLYETIVVSIPLIKVYDCDEDEPKPCNEEIIKILNQKGSDDSDDSGSENVFSNIKW